MSRNVDEFRSSTDSLEHDLVKWINGYLYWRIRDTALPAVMRYTFLSLIYLLSDF